MIDSFPFTFPPIYGYSGAVCNEKGLKPNESDPKSPEKLVADLNRPHRAVTPAFLEDGPEMQDGIGG
jgi:hypothetical protein